MKISFKTTGLLLSAGILSLAACNSGDTKSSTSDSSTSSMAPGGDTGRMAGTVDTSSNPTASAANANPDQSAIDYLVPANTKELAWLMAGVNQGTDKELKAHAKMMIADHQKLGGKVKDLIAKKGLTMPTVDTANIVSLTGPKGKEWDKQFADKMVADHAELLGKLNEFESSVKDADLKTLVTNTKPVVQSHLDMSKKMQAKM